MKLDQNLTSIMGRARLKCDGTRAETRSGLSAQRTSHLNRRGAQFSRLLAAEVCASAVVMVVMLDSPCSEVECKTTGYPLHSPSLPIPCVTVCHQVSTELYLISRCMYSYGRPPLWSSGQGFWLQIQRSRFRFPALPDFLSGSGSGTGCTQPREPREVN